MEIQGTSSIVTGGASGLGEATVRLLAQRGARVVVLDMQDDKGKELATEVGGLFVHADVTSATEVIAGVEAARELGPLRSLVCCAGIASAMRTIGRDGSYESAFDIDHFSRVIAINLIGTFNCVRLAASAMSREEPLEDNERGAIVNTASLAAFDGQIGQAAYSASKGGIVGLTLPLARDLAVSGIRVNTVAPGLIDTPIYGSGEAAEEFKDRLKKDVVFPDRLGRPDEFARLVLELLTNSYMNGETVRLDAAARLQPK
jgi:NAD(P)-dependent dehydrogenase (short-subunit alcohol dehydrogenase family)